ncbi:MAG: TetR/AcrR family transcriptional regulator [Deltaproteobacteria bacterium]|nr:TetR/AcrR family transcriptional regulator [Deltaproteobacteria bacterium]MBW2397854.1 TetR/AcrR family transcriptional regulator [Deltaproteobacteria bacterium]MBW2665004.1 TetR/AcrR family transcriptional regulator [Deltaproteobacteria bacterium]
MEPSQQPRPFRRRDPLSTREAILCAARELVAERGPEGMTISEVAHRAGVNRGTAYQHFRNRGELATAVHDWFGGTLAMLLSSDLPVSERIDRFLEFIVGHPEYARLWIDEMLSIPNGRPNESWKTFVAALEVFAESIGAQPGIDPERLGRILVSAPLVWSLWANRAVTEEDRSLEVRHFSHEIKRMLLFGVLNPEAWPEMVAEVAKPALADKAQ